MLQKRSSDKPKPVRSTEKRILFATVPVLFLIAAVCAITWFVRRDTPEKAIMRTMKQISSLDESAILQVAEAEDAHGGSGAAISALERYFEHFSCKVVSVSQNKDTADALILVTAPDARALASDIRLYLLKDSTSQIYSDLQDNSVRQVTQDTSNSADQDRIFSLMQQCLSEKEYPQAETEGALSLKKTKDGWTVIQTTALSSLLLGGLPEALSDPFLLTPDMVLTVFLEELDSLSAEEWAVVFNVHDLFSTYAADASQIDIEFLSQAKEAFSWSGIRADTSGAHSDVSLTVTSTDTGAILRDYKEKLESYGQTIDAVSADSNAVSRKSSLLLLESISENESDASFPVTISMTNNGTGWVITDSSALTDALFGGMCAAVEEFGREEGEDR